MAIELHFIHWNSGERMGEIILLLFCKEESRLNPVRVSPVFLLALPVLQLQEKLFAFQSEIDKVRIILPNNLVVYLVSLM